MKLVWLSIFHNLLYVLLTTLTWYDLAFHAGWETVTSSRIPLSSFTVISALVLDLNYIAAFRKGSLLKVDLRSLRALRTHTQHKADACDWKPKAVGVRLVSLPAFCRSLIMPSWRWALTCPLSRREISEDHTRQPFSWSQICSETTRDNKGWGCRLASCFGNRVRNEPSSVDVIFTFIPADILTGAGCKDCLTYTDRNKRGSPAFAALIDTSKKRTAGEKEVQQ